MTSLHKMTHEKLHPNPLLYGRGNKLRIEPTDSYGDATTLDPLGNANHEVRKLRVEYRGN